MASWAGKGYKLQGSVETCLSSLQQECSSTEYAGALRTILRTLKNVQEHPGEGSYKQIKKTNKTFSQKVWMFNGGQQLMYSIGWTDLDDTIVLLDSRHVLATISLIEARLRCSPPGRASVAKSAQSAKGRQAYQSGWSNMAAGGSKGWTGGSNGSTGGSNGSTGGSNGSTGGSDGWSEGSNGWSEGSNGWSGGSNGWSGGSNGWSGGSNGWSGGSNGWSGGSNQWSGSSNGGCVCGQCGNDDDGSWECQCGQCGTDAGGWQCFCGQCGEEDCDSWTSTYQTQKPKTTVAKKPRKPRATRSSYGGSYGSSGYGSSYGGGSYGGYGGGASCSTGGG